MEQLQYRAVSLQSRIESRQHAVNTNRILFIITEKKCKRDRLDNFYSIQMIVIFDISFPLAHLHHYDNVLLETRRV